MNRLACRLGFFSNLFPIILLVLADSIASTSSPPPTTPTRTKYRYEGPDGCNSKECDCRTETNIEQELGSDGNASPFFVKTLHCQNATGTLLVFKIPQFVTDSASSFKRICAQLWDAIRYYISEGTAIVSNAIEVCRSKMAVEFNRTRQNAKKTVNDDDEDSEILEESFENDEAGQDSYNNK